jgi:hypothetical protein
VDRDVEVQIVAGKGARAMAEKRRLNRLRHGLTGLLCLGLILAINWINIRALKSPTVKIGAALVCALGLVAIDRRILPMMDFLIKRESDAARGAEAEETVGAVLNRLSDEHMVLHDVPGPCGNIDHVILRKDGAVFVIETKSAAGNVSERNGQLLINGKAPEKDFIRQTLRNVVWVRDVVAAELGVIPWVDGALVFTRAYVSIRCDIEQIRVMNVRFLEEWMARAPRKNEIARRAGPNWEKIRKRLQNEGSGSSK